MSIHTPYTPLDKEALSGLIGVVIDDQQYRYALNKARGGANGKKGSRYEDFVGAYVLAGSLGEVLNGIHQSDWPRLISQDLGFVDDLTLSSSFATVFHQLKNVQSLSWSSGPHPLADDFRLQLALADSQGWANPSVVLFTSDPTIAAEMEATLPHDLANRSTVRHFPGDTMNVLVQTHEPLREVLRALARSSRNTVEDDELSAVMGALISALMRAPSDDSIEALLALAQKQSPTLVRLLPHQMERVAIAPQVVTLLDSIQGFCYCFDRGFFEWNCGPDSGLFSFTCLDRRFSLFQNRVLADKSTTFEALETILECFCE